MSFRLSRCLYNLGYRRPLGIRNLSALPKISSSTKLQNGRFLNVETNNIRCSGFCSRNTVLETSVDEPDVLHVLNQSTRGCVDVAWSTGEVTFYPHVWLRDNCTCSQCHHPTAGGRQFSMRHLDINISPSIVQSCSDRFGVKVVWSDDHESFYRYHWLKDRSFWKSSGKAGHQIEHAQRLWDGSKVDECLYKVPYGRLMDDLSELHKSLLHLIEYGVLVVRSSPTECGVVEKLANRLGQIKLTHYGKTFSVANKLQANNLAYTGNTLDPHLDLPFYEYVPGVQLLHCIRQHTGTGGENPLVDGFYVAEQLREGHREQFQLLVSEPVQFRDVGIESDAFEQGINFHKLQQHTTIGLDQEGHVSAVRFNNAVRSDCLPVPLGTVKPLYSALKVFSDYSNAPENTVLYKMDEGDVLVFNNRRVLHGRRGFTVTEDCNRQLEGGYIDWDEILCRYRSVKYMLNNNSTDTTPVSR